MNEIPPKGTEIIKAYVKTLPLRPGVYRMLNKNADVIYVGKAKSLKNRVTSYTRMNGHTNRIQRMIAQTTAMEFIETETETEALLLEANLIKKFQPPFNVLLRDNKMFPYLMITDKHDFPLLTKYRGTQKKQNSYFGPFASPRVLHDTLAILQKAFMLRNCSDSIFENRTRPCLQYQIKRCSAPCVDMVSKESYAAQVKDAKEFLKGYVRDIQTKFAKDMEEASDNLEFEKAASLRDRIKALNQAQASQKINLPSLGDVDVIAYDRQAGISCIQVFFFRQGRNHGNKSYFPSHTDEDKSADIFSAFMAQFYLNKPIPSEVIVSLFPAQKDLLIDALQKQKDKKVSITLPKRGDKKSAIDMALHNAKEALARRLSQTQGQKKLRESLVGIFGLNDTPKRIEVYDNSHISGTNAIGAMIVAGEHEFLKNQYRKYNIKGDYSDGDDYAMMREVFERRFTRALKEDPDRLTENWPDLILVDGGKGQVSSAHGVMVELGVDDISLFGVSKGPDRNAGKEIFHRVDGSEFALPMTHESLYFIQRLRDESHRFAIGSHRVKRKKEMIKSPLDDIKGVGAKRKKALLMHFGSAKAVAGASLDDLKNVDGVNAKTAELIYDYFINS